jgi:hypothetical protein
VAGPASRIHRAEKHKNYDSVGEKSIRLCWAKDLAKSGQKTHFQARDGHARPSQHIPWQSIAAETKQPLIVSLSCIQRYVFSIPDMLGYREKDVVCFYDAIFRPYTPEKQRFSDGFQGIFPHKKGFAHILFCLDIL